MTRTDHPWRSAFAAYAHPRVAAMLFLGFSAGLPFLLVFGTLSYWLAEAGVDRAKIGYLSWVGLAYGFKFVWSPLVDRLPLPWLSRRLGQRRAWLLLSQIAVAAGLWGLAQADPAIDLAATVAFALLAAFASATQDIALDAWRIEAVEVTRQGAMAASYQTGYRLAMIVSGAGALAIVAATDPSRAYEFAPWQTAYRVMAGLMLVGVLATLAVGEPTPDTRSASRSQEARARAWLARHGVSGTPLALAAWFHGAVLSPFADFVGRFRWHGVVILGLIACYRISDVVMGVMSNVFYQEMGFTPAEVATVSKVYGVIMTLAGAGLGGLLVARLGVMRTLLLGAVASAATNLLFVWLVGRGHDVGALVFTVSADNLSAGIASSAFVAYLSALVNQAYSATQYALFSSLMALLPKLLAGFSGWFVDVYGWATFFAATAALGVPVVVLVILAARTPRSADA